MKEEVSSIVKAERALERALVTHRRLTDAVEKRDCESAAYFAGLVSDALTEYKQCRAVALREFQCGGKK